MHKTLWTTLGALLVITLLLIPQAHTESVTKFVTKEDQIRDEMVKISRELGVTCAECHNVNNFTEAKKATFKVSREHMKITQLLKERGFDGKKGPEASCYMCHRGKLKPDYKEPLSAKAQ
ncbi:Photosynthetic reaction centre cytochrome C subunit [compost metagenome]